jgi:hypothetical protein
MRIQTLRRIGAVVLCVAVLAAIGLGIITWWIQTELTRCCVMAQAAHPHARDNVASLLDYVQSPDHSLRDRDRAVWALAQCRDGRALPILESLKTGRPCDHEHDLCQYELDKAIRQCSGRAAKPPTQTP